MNEKKNVSEFNKNNDKTGKLKDSGKNTNCPAELSFSISSPCQSVCVTDTHVMRNEYSLEIKLHYNHNHAIQAAEAMRFRPVSEDTKKLFTGLFDEDISRSSAYEEIFITGKQMILQFP